VTEPWMDAWTRRLEAIRILEQMKSLAKGMKPGSMAQQDWHAMTEYEFDLVSMREAQTYAWFDPATAAVEQAALTVPTDVRIRDFLSEVRGMSGWWWFTRPLEVYTLPHPQPTAALLWSIVDASRAQKENRSLIDAPNESFIQFSVYTTTPIDGFPPTTPIPSSLWRWPIDATLDEAVVRLADSYDRVYGPNGKFRNSVFGQNDQIALLGRERTIEAAMRLSRFFLAGMVWLRQTILKTVEGAVPRQQRRDLERKTGRPQLPVRIISLRHMQLIRPAGPELSETTKKHYTHRWVVSGHWRQQPYGPGHMSRRLKYIHPYMKGPEDGDLLDRRDPLYVVLK
jgi:hypothetical protein